MCGRYASSRQPEDLVEEFEIRNPDLPNLEPDFNVAPTEEMILITFAMDPTHLIGLMACSVLLLHALVYTVGFAGQERQAEGVGPWTTFLTYTLAGYGLALLLSAYVLWTFGRTDDASLSLVAMMAVVLAFPASLGAGIARLVV